MASIFINLIKESERIVDSNYFIENILFDSKNIRKLLKKAKLLQSNKLLELVSLIIKKMFEVKNEVEN